MKTGKWGLARVTGGATTAARTVDLLGAIFTYAIKGGLRTDNPVAGFECPPGNRRERTLLAEDVVHARELDRRLSYRPKIVVERPASQAA